MRVFAGVRRQIRFLNVGVREQAHLGREIDHLREELRRIEAELRAYLSVHGQALEAHASRIDELTRSVEAVLTDADDRSKAYRTPLIDVAARLAALEGRVGDKQ